MNRRSSSALMHRLRQLWQRPPFDPPLLIGLLCLCAIGLIVLYSASGGSYAQVLNQSLRLGLGLLVMLILARTPPTLFRTWAPWLYLVAVGLLVLVLFFGEGRGAHRWLDIGFMRFQPSELVKLSLPLMVAWYLNGRALPPTFTSLLATAVLITVPCALIIKQPDLGTALLVAASGVFVIFLSGIRWRWIFGVLGSLAAIAPYAWNHLHEYQRNRVRMFLDPEADPLGNGWNIIQSKIAVGSGGWIGKGWMDGTQSRLDYLPEHTTDFIFSVFSEEFGLVGVVLVIFLYAFIIGRSMWIAAEARDTFTRLLAGSLAMTFFVYVMVNGGMISGLLPVVGVPMPLISYGGTSAVTLLAGFGILMSIHAHRRSSDY